LVLRCLDLAFIDRREYSVARLASFLKRIWTVCLHAPPETAVPLLAFTRQLLQRYSGTSLPQLLENELDIVTSGKYDPEIDDPERSNPFATVGWELALLKFRSVPPDIGAHARGAANCQMLNMPGEDPERLRVKVYKSRSELYVPLVRHQKKHPLASSNTPRFVTPRAQALRIVSPEK
jgi:CBF/Mak21 family